MRREPFVSDLFFQLDLRLNSEKGGDTSTYVTNGEWDLQGELCPVSLHSVALTRKIMTQCMHLIENTSELRVS